MSKPKPDYPNPFLWVPSSYLAMGLIYVAVGSVANIMFKNMGMDNDKAALFSSLLGFPYIFKFLWAPLLELYKTKKFFVVLMQFLLALAMTGVAFCVILPGMTWLVPVLAMLAVASILGATQDIGSDGVYVTTLVPKDQAKYTGFQSMCWNAGALLAAGPLIYFTGVLHEGYSTFSTSEITNASSFVEKVQEKKHAVSIFLSDQFEKSPQKDADKHGDLKKDNIKQNKSILLQKLNKVVEGPCIYEKERFQNFSLRPETAELLKQEPQGDNLARLNRLLIEDAYPDDFLRHQNPWDWGKSWMLIMLIIAGVMLLAGLYHSRMLPPGAKALDAPKNFGDAMGTFGHAFLTFFQKKDVWSMIAFAFFYRIGFGLIDKIGPLFMIDERAKGGLGLDNQMLGTINGTIGFGAFIVGSILGGWIVSRAGLKKSLLILCLCLNVPNVTFLILSQWLPTNIYLIGVVVTFEKLFWGIGCVGHMIYMMQQIAPGPYKTAHYTFATALMGACMMSTGAVSGYIQTLVGYQWFFIIVLFAAGPSLLVTLLAPFHHPDSAGPGAAVATEDLKP
jgi:MFS family permease